MMYLRLWRRTRITGSSAKKPSQFWFTFFLFAFSVHVDAFSPSFPRIRGSLPHPTSVSNRKSLRLHSEDKSRQSPLNQMDAEFERFSKIHKVVEKLKQQIPNLLSIPLTESSSKAVYEENVKLVVAPARVDNEEAEERLDDIVLASSREEIVSLSTTFVLAVMATNQANSFVSLLPFGSPDGTAIQKESQPIALQGKMLIDPLIKAIGVQWQTNLPGGGDGGDGADARNNRRQLKGLSELELDEISGKVKVLRLLRVQWNEEDLNARAIAESLASLRQFVFAFQESPLLKALLPNSVRPSISSLLQEMTSQQGTSGEKYESAPLYVVDALDTAFGVASKNSSRPEGDNSTATSQQPKMIPIDEYVNTNTSIPLPGSRIWERYVVSRNIMDVFLQETVPILSGTRVVPSEDMISLFGSQATLKAMDGSELLRGRDSVGNYFHTLSSFRKRSSSSWNMTNATLTDWDDELKVTIDYESSSSLPGSSSPIRIEGTDVFVLEKPMIAMERSDDDGDSDDIEILVQRVEQRRLKIEGVGQNTPDGLWFMKSLVAALDTGRFSSVGADSVIMDLFQKVIAGETAPNSVLPVNGDGKKSDRRKKRKSPPKLPEPVAARMYNIMAHLHRDIPSIFETENLRIDKLPPLHEFVSDEVELRGYLGETLARGTRAYNRAVRATFASLKAAIATGSVSMEDDPSISVELTTEGNVRLSLTLDLKVLPIPAGASDLISSMNGTAIFIPTGGVPLKIVMTSEYIVEKQSGQIFQHKLVQTRINGQLTPGDVISRWIQRQVKKTPASPPSGIQDGIALQRSLIEAVSWVRSLGSENNKRN